MATPVTPQRSSALSFTSTYNGNAESSIADRIPKTVRQFAGAPAHIKNKVSDLTSQASSVVKSVMQRTITGIDSATTSNKGSFTLRCGNQRIQANLAESTELTNLIQALTVTTENLMTKQLSEETKKYLDDCADCITKKLAYHQQYHSTDQRYPLELLGNTLKLLNKIENEELSDEASGQRDNSDIKAFTLIVYAHPQLINYKILQGFLDLCKIPDKYSISNIYAHFQEHILNQENSFQLTLNDPPSEREKLSEPMASFLKSIKYTISTEKHDVEKVVRRFDKGFANCFTSFRFIEVDLLGNTLTPEKNDLMHTAIVEFIKALSDNDLLLEKADNSYAMITITDSFKLLCMTMKGTPLDTSSMLFETSSNKEKRCAKLQHLYAVKDTFPELMYTHFLDIKNKITQAKQKLQTENDSSSTEADRSQLPKNESMKGTISPKLLIREVTTILNHEVMKEFTQCLDKVIIDLSRHLATQGKLFSSVQDSDDKIEEWKNATKHFLENADQLISDESIDKIDRLTVEQGRVDIRSVFINGFSIIILQIDEDLPDAEAFLYDNCVAGILVTLTNHLKHIDTNTHTLYGKNKQAIIQKIRDAFLKTKSNIHSIIGTQEEEYAKTCIRSFVEFFHARHTTQESGQPVEDKKTRTSRIANTIQELEHWKNYLGMLLGITVDSEKSEMSDHLVTILTSGSSSKPGSCSQTKDKLYLFTEEDILKALKKSSTCFQISRHSNNLAPAENFRTSLHFKSTQESVFKMLELTSLALQKSKLQIQKDISDSDIQARSQLFFDNTIHRLMGQKSLTQCSPIAILKDAINTILPSTLTTAHINEKLSSSYEKSLAAYDMFSTQNYHRSDQGTWQDDIVALCELHNCLSDLRMDDDDNQQQLDTAKNLIRIIINSFCEAYSCEAAAALPPSLEIVKILQSLMALQLTCTQPCSREDARLKSFQVAICKYNDHFKTVEEQMAEHCYQSQESASHKVVDTLDRTFKDLQRKVRNEAIQDLMDQLMKCQDDKDELLTQLNEELIRLSEQGFFIKHFRNSPLGTKPLQKIIKLLNKGEYVFLGGFFCIAVVNMMYIKQGTDMLKLIQKEAPKTASSLANLQNIYNQLKTQYPNLAANATTLMHTPSTTVTTTGELAQQHSGDFNCLMQIHNNRVGQTAQTFDTSMQTAQSSHLQAMREIFYSDANECPSGGTKAFPTTFVNPPNLFSSIVSILTGAASITTWGMDVTRLAESVRTHSSLPILFQEFPPVLNEKLLTLSAQKQNPNKPLTDCLYTYNQRGWKEWTQDLTDKLINSRVKFDSKFSVKFGISVIHQVLSYFTFGPMSMAVQDRPHSVEELQDRVEYLATQRKLKTVYRMLGYNTFKELMDVFSTKSSTLAFLFFLKEFDWFNAFNEKAGIANYASMKTGHERTTHALMTLCKKGALQDSFQTTAVKRLYGEQLTKQLMGENQEITHVETEDTIKRNGTILKVLGTTGVFLCYGGQAFNLFRYSYQPWTLANATIQWLHDRTSSSNQTQMIQEIIKKAQKTIDREYDPYHLSDQTAFWHYLFGQRAGTKYEQTAVLWFLKETININMFLNTTANERELGVTCRNWEVFAATCAYLLKDSTGILARLGTLMDSELIRTLFSFLDKIDSPVAEMVIGRLGRYGMSPPQSVIESVNSMLEEIMHSENGSPDKIHAVAGKKFKALLDIGLPTLNKVAKSQEARAIEVFDNKLKQKSDTSTSPNWEPENQKQYPYLAIKLRNELEKTVPVFGMEHSDAPSDLETGSSIQYLEEFMKTKAPWIDYTNPEHLFGTLHELSTKISKETMDVYLNKVVREKLRSLEPKQKNELRNNTMTAAEQRRATNEPLPQNVQFQSGAVTIVNIDADEESTRPLVAAHHYDTDADASVSTEYCEQFTTDPAGNRIYHV